MIMLGCMAQRAAMASETHGVCNSHGVVVIGMIMFGCMAQCAAMASKTHGVCSSHGAVIN